MAISDFEIKRCERELDKFMEVKRPPPQVRSQLDFGYRINNQSVELYEIRPEWRNPSNVREFPFAKTTFVKSKKAWKIYWQRQDLKWHSYEPMPEVKYFEDFLSIVSKDEYGCFFG